MINTIWKGESIPILKNISQEIFNLIYLDPPFFTNRRFGIAKNSKIIFDDLWEKGINEYLDFMNDTLIHTHRILKKTGLLFLHCDYHASHYLKVELDKIFGVKNFRNEIIWKRHNSQNNAKQGAKIFGRIHDTIFVYSKTQGYVWNQPYGKYPEKYLKRTYNKIDDLTGEKFAYGDLTGPGGASKGNPCYEFLGIKRHWRYNKEKMLRLLKEGRIIQTKPGTVPKFKRFLTEMKGVPLSDIWFDISNVQTTSKNAVFYPTQKPIELLERIIQCSTNEGDLVLDPFCGSGTTMLAAYAMKRNFVGIDKNPEAIKVSIKRLHELGITKKELVVKELIAPKKILKNYS